MVTPTPTEDSFPFPHAVGLADARGTLRTAGDETRIWPLASVSKPIAALGALVAVQRGLVDLDEPAGPPGATVRHLLAHAAGYAFDSGTAEDPGEPIAAPGRRRIYSNTGFLVLGRHLEEATGRELPDWIEESVLAPLGLVDLDVSGSPAAGYTGSVRDLLVIGREMLRPTLVDADLWAEATRVQFPGLAGILPGYGRQSPNDWGLGVEIRGRKHPHWTGADASPATIGHFGQSGSFLWADPEAGLTAAFLGDEPFGPVHQEHWPALNDALLREGAASA